MDSSEFPPRLVRKPPEGTGSFGLYHNTAAMAGLSVLLPLVCAFGAVGIFGWFKIGNIFVALLIGAIIGTLLVVSLHGRVTKAEVAREEEEARAMRAETEADTFRQIAEMKAKEAEGKRS